MNKVCVEGQHIYFYRRPEPIPKSQVNFSRIEFYMDETWSRFLSVVAQFIQNGEPKNVQVKDGYCFVPPGLEVGAFELCLRGDDGESVVASVNRLTLEVCEGFDPSGETPLPPSPDLYTQLIKEIDSGKKIAQSVREDADAGKFNGGWYTPSVTQTDENTLRMDFTPSKGDMPDVAHTDIMLPSGGGGTSDHSKLSNRDAADQHPMSAITGLEKALGDKQPVGEYLTTETDPTVPSWAKEPTKPGYTAAEVGADPSGTAESKVFAHNTGTDTHSDIRLLIQGLTERLNALADSDDTTLDQLSEVVAYIKSNRTLIEAITTSKVGVTDIVNDLVTNVANKPLSAAQGVALKALIDAITIPEALPNPKALTFTGAVSGSYDGSASLKVEIPSGGGGITVTNTAAVGQTVKITAVDENGQPTKWEAVDMAEQVQPDWNQNDSTAADYVKNRTHYEESTYVDYVLNMSGTGIVGLSMPEVGETMTVKINGVESTETVKEAESSIVGGSYKYIGNIDLDSLVNGGTGWLASEFQGQVVGFANPDTAIAVKSIVVHKINDKFINFDGFVRTFDYHFGHYNLYKTLYNDNGEACSLYKCDNIVVPKPDSTLFGFMGDIGFSNVGSTMEQSCFINGFTINADGSNTLRNVVLGTNTSEMEKLAANYDYTLTANPNA